MRIGWVILIVVLFCVAFIWYARGPSEVVDISKDAGSNIKEDVTPFYNKYIAKKEAILNGTFDNQTDGANGS